jgi:hypothetical protein
MAVNAVVVAEMFYLFNSRYILACGAGLSRLKGAKTHD